MAREVLEEVTVKGPNGKKGVCIVYTDGTIFIEWVRLSYPHLVSPKAFQADDDDDDDGDKKSKATYSVTGMLGKKTHAAAIRLIEEQIAKILKTNKVKKLKAEKLFLRDGDDSENEEYEGCMTVSTREVNRPPLRDVNGKKFDLSNKKQKARAQALFVGGHWGAMLIRPWWMNNKWGKRVNAGISSAQFLMKDETFGEGRLSEEAMDDTFRSHGDPDDDDDGSYDDDDDEDGDDYRRRSKKRRDDDDDDDDEDDRAARRKAKAKKAKRRSRDDDDDEDDDI
jgi:hypothetical protein